MDKSQNKCLHCRQSLFGSYSIASMHGMKRNYILSGLICIDQNFAFALLLALVCTDTSCTCCTSWASRRFYSWCTIFCLPSLAGVQFLQAVLASPYPYLHTVGIIPSLLCHSLPWSDPILILPWPCPSLSRPLPRPLSHPTFALLALPGSECPRLARLALVSPALPCPALSVWGIVWED